MRPHSRIFPLALALVISMFTALAIPVDANERLCRDTPDDARCDMPAWQPWILRWMTEGY
jgi:hypothetical protein